MSCFWVNAPSYSCSSYPLKFWNQWTYNLIPHHAQQIKPCPFRISRSLLQKAWVSQTSTIHPYRLPLDLILTCLIHIRSVCQSLTHTLRPLKLSRCPLQRSHSLQGVESGVTSEACLANGYRAMVLNQSFCQLPPLVSPAGNPNRSSPKLFVSLWRLWKIGASTRLFKKKM